MTNTPSPAAPLWGKMRQATSDAQILVLGDSTADGRSVANGPYEDGWVELLADKIAAEFPEWQVEEARWLGGVNNYWQPVEVRQVGTNGRTLTVWNGAEGGMTWDHDLTTPDAHWRDLNPDLIIINHGHNDAATAQPERAYQLTETVTVLHPYAGVAVCAQNPRTDANAAKGAERAEIMREFALVRGFGLIDAYNAFLHSGQAISTLLAADGLHPTAAGYAVWADEAWRALWTTGATQPTAQLPSTLTVPVREVLTNARFADTWDGTGAPPGWTLSANAAASKDAAHYETGAYGVQIEQLADTGGVRGYIEQSIPVAPYVGQWVTLGVRLLIDEAMTTPQVGTIEIADSTGSHRPRQSTQARGRYFWAFATRKIPASATGNLTVRVYNDFTLSAGMASKPVLDRVTLARGIFPRDVL